MDCSLPGSSVQVSLQARILEWVAMLFFKAKQIPSYFSFLLFIIFFVFLGHLFLQWQSVSAGTVLSEQEWLPGQWVPCQVQEGETVLFPHKWFPPPPAPTRAGRGVSVAIKFPRPRFFPFCPPCNSSSAVVGLLSHVQLF